jgi:hypothetical protein
MLSQFSTRQQLVDACMASAHGARAACGSGVRQRRAAAACGSGVRQRRAAAACGSGVFLYLTVTLHEQFHSCWTVGWLLKWEIRGERKRTALNTARQLMRLFVPAASTALSPGLASLDPPFHLSLPLCSIAPPPPLPPSYLASRGFTVIPALTRHAAGACSKLSTRLSCASARTTTRR